MVYTDPFVGGTAVASVMFEAGAFHGIYGISNYQ